MITVRNLLALAVAASVSFASSAVAEEHKSAEAQKAAMATETKHESEDVVVQKNKHVEETHEEVVKKEHKK